MSMACGANAKGSGCLCQTDIAALHGHGAGPSARRVRRLKKLGEISTVP